jgi:glycosyltransferase involved in cell wall biosynthesis
VNNACTDDSPAYAKYLSDADNRIKVIDEPKKGIVFALNSGLSRCSSDLIARMDSDDFSLPDRLMMQYEYMRQHQDIELCSCLVRHVPDSADTKGYDLYVDWINKIMTHEHINVSRFIESPLAHPSVVFRKSAIEKNGPYRQGNFPEDYEMWLRWLENGARMSKIDRFLLHWHDSPSRLSRSGSRYSQEAFYKVKMTYLDRWLRENNPYFPKIAVWGAGRYARKRAKYLIEKGHEVITYIDIDPKKAIRDDCTFYMDIAESGSVFIVNLAGKRGAGRSIRMHLEKYGYVEGKDYIMAAGI